MDEKDLYGKTPLHNACIFSHTATAVALIERGAGVNEKGKLGFTPLHFACISGHTATAVGLIERRANVNEKDQLYGKFPLRHASGVILPQR